MGSFGQFGRRGERAVDEMDGGGGRIRRSWGRVENGAEDGVRVRREGELEMGHEDCCQFSRA